MSTSVPAATAGEAALRELALDLRWSWNHSADRIWRALDTEIWDATQNPCVVLNTISSERITTLFNDPGFARDVDRLLAEKRRLANTPAWFQERHPKTPLRNVAYFSMEFMLAEALPIYSGGLGNVAGDQLKAASDLGVPVIGIGLLYSQGYFRQAIRADGSQEALYPTNDPSQLPVRPLRDARGEWLRLRHDLPGAALWIRAWEVQVGGCKLYLLDTNDPANTPAHRCITSELYGGGPELRLQQEMVLGIGGWRLLHVLGIAPEVCHLNEGHAALAALERAGQFRDETGASFAEALLATRAGNIFTTHTAVPAGFDRFAPALVGKFLAGYAELRLGISLDALLALGRGDPRDAAEPFNMAYLATRTSSAVSAVSALHEQVSKRLFAPLYPRWPVDDIPMGHVTNGIHVPSWDSAEADRLWTEAAGKDRWRGDLSGLDDAIRAVDAPRLWQLRTGARQSLVTHIRRHHVQQLAEAGADEREVAAGRQVFDPTVLTLGFARRFATYKRPNLLLHDPARLARILLSREYPVQIVVAGKAHPADQAGQDLVKQWTLYARRPELQSRVVFLADYDMLMSQGLVQGVDVWINTPERPWEASGTSGMKLLANGGLNLSELDGWWAEAYAPDIGWAIGDGREHESEPGRDAVEADMLYSILEEQIVPEFYDRGADGIPARWVARIRESMARLAPRYSTNRAVRDYTEQLYLPAAARYVARSADGGRSARALRRWNQDVAARWPELRFGARRTSMAGSQRMVSVEIFLGGLAPEAIRVELYADSVVDGAAPRCIPMTEQVDEVGAAGERVYGAVIPADQPDKDFTARVSLCKEELLLPLEANLIAWQH